MTVKSLGVLACAALLAACSASASMESAAPAAANESSTQKADASTAAAIDAALAGAHRSDANKARDAYRHPKETLTFFGLRPDMQVVEIWPGGGWYTEVLAPVLREKGKLYGAHVDPGPAGSEPPRGLVSYRGKLAANPGVYDKVTVTAFGQNAQEIAPPGSVDMVVSFRNIHNWMGRDWAPQAFQAMHRALKPGGVLGIVEHRGRGEEQDPKAASGYVNEDYAIKMIEAAGFKLVGRSNINNNPKDTKDYAGGVWTLPPNLRNVPEADKAKYQAIGESDRFTLKFVKPN